MTIVRNYFGICCSPDIRKHFIVRDLEYISYVIIIELSSGAKLLEFAWYLFKIFLGKLYF